MVNKQLIIIFFVLMFFSTIGLRGQEFNTVVIDPIKNTSIKKWKTDLFVYGMGGSIKNSTLWTATNGNLTTLTDYDIYNTLADFGITASFYRNNLFRYCASLGYMYSRYAINRGLKTDGLLSNWVCLDVTVGAQLGFGLFINAGIKGNLFIAGSNKATGGYQYLGLNNDCYNKFSNSWYVGAAYNIKILKFELKFGSYITPLLSANKIAYYNLGKTYVEGLFFEFGLGIKIFSTTNKYNSLMDY